MTRRSRWVRLNSRGDPILDRCPACGDELSRGDKPNHFEEHDPADFGLSREAVPRVGLGADHSPDVVVTNGGRVCSECGEPATTRTDDGRLVYDDYDPSEDDPLLVTDGGVSSDAASGRLAHAKRVGETIEHALNDAIPSLSLVNAPVEHHDAVARRAIAPERLSVPAVSTTPVVPARSEIEIKACRVRQGSRQRRGQWVIRRDQHRTLVDHAAFYALVVWRSESVASSDRQREPVAVGLVPARSLSPALDGRWHDCLRDDEQRAKLTWSNVVPPAIVDGDGGEPQ